jgi:hypothetical protein
VPRRGARARAGDTKATDFKAQRAALDERSAWTTEGATETNLLAVAAIPVQRAQAAPRSTAALAPGKAQQGRR